MIKAEITTIAQTVGRAATEVLERFRGLSLNEAEANAIHQRINERTRRIKPEQGIKVTLPKDGANHDITTTLTKEQAQQLRNQLLLALQELNGPEGQQMVLITLDNVQSLDINTRPNRWEQPFYPYDRVDARLTAERATFAFATQPLGQKDLSRLLHVFERPVIEIKAGRS